MKKDYGSTKIDHSLLKDSERQLMEVFWSHSELLTGNDVAKLMTDSSWQQSNILRTLSALVQKKFLHVAGHTLIGKHYVRQFAASISREEYAVQAALSTGIEKGSLAKVSVRLAESIGGRDELIQNLEAILESLKEE